MNKITLELQKTLEKNENILDKLYCMKARWQDESEYEDFEEYLEVARRLFDDTKFIVVNLTKQFKINLRYRATSEKAFIQLKAKAYQYGSC